MPVATQGATTTLHNAVTATSTGPSLSMADTSRLAVQVSGTFSGTVTFEGSIDDASFFVVGLKTAADGVAVASTTAAGAWKIPADGPPLSAFRANITTYASGSVTVKARTQFG